MTDLYQQCIEGNQKYEQNKDEIRKARVTELQEKRGKACSVAKEKILDNYEQKMKDSAEQSARKWAILFEWAHEDDLKVEDCYLWPLLTRGELLAQLQAHFDEKHMVNGERKFTVYCHESKKKDATVYSVSVSWDVDKFDSLQKKNSRILEKSKPRSSRNREPKSQDQDSDSKAE